MSYELFMDCERLNFTGLDLLNIDIKLRIKNAFKELAEFKKLHEELTKEWEIQQEKKTNPIPPNLRGKFSCFWNMNCIFLIEHYFIPNFLIKKSDIVPNVCVFKIPDGFMTSFLPTGMVSLFLKYFHIQKCMTAFTSFHVFCSQTKSWKNGSKKTNINIHAVFALRHIYTAYGI